MALEMVSTNLSYQRLRNFGDFEEGGEEEKALFRTRSWRRFRRTSSRRRSRLKIPSLRRFLRRKARLCSSSWVKVWKRLKESRNHLGDLFAGNFMFMQVTPTPIKCLDKSFMALNHPYGFPSSQQPLGKLVRY
ncbi:hypothetical protein ACLOJK_009184 [Asimina triloba]